jgi:hypothetical protein
MPQAILTKYLPRTNYRGSRIKATCDRGSITVPYDHGASNPHKEAALALVRKFMAEDAKKYDTPQNKNPWRGPWMEGGLPGNNGSVFVSVYANDSFEVAP